MTLSTDRFDGRLVLPAEADFEEAVLGRVFNGRRPDRRPDAVLLAASEQDVEFTVAINLYRYLGAIRRPLTVFPFLLFPDFVCNNRRV